MSTHSKATLDEYLQHMFLWRARKLSFEQPHDKTNKMASPPSLIRVVAVHMKKAQHGLIRPGRCQG